MISQMVVVLALVSDAEGEPRQTRSPIVSFALLPTTKGTKGRSAPSV